MTNDVFELVSTIMAYKLCKDLLSQLATPAKISLPSCLQYKKYDNKVQEESVIALGTTLSFL